MSKAVILEVSRAVYLAPQSTFIDDVNAYARRILDSEGNSVVAFRPSNAVVSTVHQGANLDGALDLRYTHLFRFGANQRHLGSKVVDLASNLSENEEKADTATDFDIVNLEEIDQKIGHQPLSDSMESLRRLFFASKEAKKHVKSDLDYDAMPLVDLSRLEVTSAPFDASKTLFVLRGEESRKQDTGTDLIFGMSRIALEAVTRRLKRFDELQAASFEDGVVIGSTRIRDFGKISSFVGHVNEELLAIPLQVEPGAPEIKVSTRF